MNRMRALLATWFGSGLFPVASGTAGTLATVPLVLLLWWTGSSALHLAAAALVFAAGVWAARGAERRWGRSDPGQVVIDEAAGYLLATAALAPSLVNLVASFLLFRALDVIKPWPARSLERLRGEWGIMADDVAAGLYTNLLLRLAAVLLGIIS
jgi:phosphatidylglycerophosphatase A